MTRTQAWREVATMFDLPLRERTSEQVELTSDGLCYAISGLPDHDLTIYDQMEELGSKGRYIWPRRTHSDGRPTTDWAPKCDGIRATFAALMAAMTQRERDQLVKGL